MEMEMGNWDLLKAIKEAMQKVMDAYKAKMAAAHEEIMAKLDVPHERIMSCVGKTESMYLETNPEEMQSGEEHQEVPKMPQWKLAKRRISGIGSGV
jgi:hypothetical protein